MTEIIAKDVFLTVNSHSTEDKVFFRKPKSVNLLKNLNLEVYSGERIGLVGPNGSGKSTLLRILSGIYKPSSGRISTVGSISCLLDSGLGLDLERTAIENIRIYGTIKGQSQKSIKARIDGILDFAGLDSYAQTPIRFFSQGMYLRLAFTLATEWSSEILFIDEGIGTGDAEFQKKAVVRLNTYMNNASILFLASHSRELVHTYCKSAILLNQGEIIGHSDIDDIFLKYSNIQNP